MLLKIITMYLEQRCVVIQIEIVKSQSHLLVDLLQRRPSFLHDGNSADWCRPSSAVKGLQGLVVLLLGHSVVQQGLDCGNGSLRQPSLALELVPARHLQPFDGHPARLANADGIGREGRSEGQARSKLELDQTIARCLGGEARPLELQPIPVKRLRQQPLELLDVAGRQGTFGANVETAFRFDSLDLVRILVAPDTLELLLHRRKEGVRGICLPVVVDDLLHHGERSDFVVHLLACKDAKRDVREVNGVGTLQ
jgi:hypothetical protein